MGSYNLSLSSSDDHRKSRHTLFLPLESIRKEFIPYFEGTYVCVPIHFTSLNLIEYFLPKIDLVEIDSSEKYVDKGYLLSVITGLIKNAPNRNPNATSIKKSEVFPFITVYTL